MDNNGIENVMPHDARAEQTVLGSIFLDGNTLADAVEFLMPEDFYNRANQVIFKAMMAVDDRGDKIDPVTVADELQRSNQLEDAGGPVYLSELMNNIPSSSHIREYAKIVQSKALLRRLISASQNIINLAQNEDDDVTEILDSAERQIMDVAENKNSAGFKSISQVLDQTMIDVQELSQQKEEITGLPTGYHDFDEMTSGLQPDNLIILAARPAVGKTAFALNIAQNVGKATDANIAIFSLEMSAESLVNRMICAEGGINANHLRNGQLDDQEWNALTVAMGTLSGTNIFIDDTPGIKMSEIRAKCRRLAKEQGGLGLIVVDYLQLIEGSNKESRQQEVSEISRQLKKLAKELKVPIIALSQLSRGVEQRQDKRPVLSDIRESGSIEQDADIVAFLYRDDYYERDSGDDDENSQEEPNDTDAGEVELIIEKNRAGSRGTVKLLFIKSYNKFANLSPMSENN
ncbi:replicative DNA helicase [Ligilactobacillus cholophilus]|uniref:replicative DNA helicase n=1 Tax=Ligilactobacillus cholophilus TaxID=3050131 RepID=UPI00338E245D